MVDTPETPAPATKPKRVRKAKAVAAPVDPALAGAAPAAPVDPAAPIVVKHRDHTGTVVERTFSKEVHGEDFAAKAAEFKANPANKIVSE